MRITLKMNPDTLGALPAGGRGVIASLEFPAQERAWVDALGLSPGRSVTVLRRGAFRGPLHVRVDSGAELAVDAELASHVRLAAGAP